MKAFVHHIELLLLVQNMNKNKARMKWLMLRQNFSVHKNYII
jgi:hypothetical protein